MWSTPAVWKQYNKMAVLHFFLVNSSLYILFSMPIYNNLDMSREAIELKLFEECYYNCIRV